MARLALLAILLLALVPTLGRFAQASEAGTAATPSWAALCTARGLESVLLTPAAPAAAHRNGEPPAPPHDAGGGCDYCPLLAAAIPSAVAPLPVSPPALPPALCTSCSPVARAEPQPGGLGSRGPPSVS